MNSYLKLLNNENIIEFCILPIIVNVNIQSYIIRYHKETSCLVEIKKLRDFYAKTYRIVVGYISSKLIPV